ncbi:MAG TPA: Rv3235 family protein [Propionibacteriaceae bacterium]|nr:Rv3235 family protein [Propionibacteriaceae bacterium]
MLISIVPSPWSFPTESSPVAGAMAEAFSPTSSDPDPVAWSAARALHEIALGNRPVSHLQGRATSHVLALLGAVMADDGLADARLTGVRSQRPLGDAGHIEVVTSLHGSGGRAVIAMRLDRSAGRWLITDLQPVRLLSPARDRGRP